MKRILFLGDSITDCEHLYSRDGLGDGYVKMLSEKLPYKLINTGTNGFMAADIKRRINIFLQSSPNFISLLVGVNDIPSITASPKSFKHFISAHEEIVVKISKKPCLIIAPFVFPSPAELINWERFLDPMRKEIKKLCEKYGAEYLPMDEIFKEELSRNEPTDLSPDGIHLTEMGHRILAEHWLEAFNRRQASP